MSIAEITARPKRQTGFVQCGECGARVPKHETRCPFCETPLAKYEVESLFDELPSWDDDDE